MLLILQSGAMTTLKQTTKFTNYVNYVMHIWHVLSESLECVTEHSSQISRESKLVLDINLYSQQRMNDLEEKATWTFFFLSCWT